MKFTICLFALFAIIGCIQAHLLKATLTGKYNDEVPTNGCIVITLFGRKTNQIFTYKKSFINDVQFHIFTEFEEDFQVALVNWKSNSGKPFYVNDFSINVDEGKYKTKFVKDKNLRSGDTFFFFNQNL